MPRVALSESSIRACEFHSISGDSSPPRRTLLKAIIIISSPVAYGGVVQTGRCHCSSWLDEGMDRRQLLSKMVHYLSWLAGVVCVLATAEWVAIVADGNYCWAAFGFMMVAGNLSAAFLFLVVLPGAIL